MLIWEEILFFLFDLEYISYLCKFWIFLVYLYGVFFE